MWYQATHSSAITIWFITLFTFIGLFVAVGSVATASRLTWAFARDNALIGSNFVRKIDQRQKIPVNALFYNAVWIAILGGLYMGSITGISTVSGSYLEFNSNVIHSSIQQLRRNWRSC